MKSTTRALAVAAITTLFAGMLMAGAVSANEVLCDPSFEVRDGCWTPWTDTRWPGSEPDFTTDRAHTGKWSARFCAYTTVECAGGYGQSFTVPAGVTTATFSFWYYTDENDPTACDDVLNVSLSTSSGRGAGLSQCSETAPFNFWTLVTLDATAALQPSGGDLAGIGIDGWANGTYNGSPPNNIPTVWYVDDISLDVTTSPTHDLTVKKNGLGVGMVTSSPYDINCGADCTEAIVADTVVTLMATPAPHSRFTGWSGGGCTGTGTCSVTMDQAQVVTATFVPTTTHRRMITLNLNSHHIAKGAVTTDDYRPCISGVAVEIQRRSAEGWRTIKSTTTTDLGTYRVSLRDRTGRYRARAPAFEPVAAHICGSARSTVIWHRH